MSKKIDFSQVKISKRELTMVLVLLIIACTFAFNKYILLPQKNQRTLLSEELRLKESTLAAQNMKLSRYSHLKAQQELANIEAYLAIEPFYPEIIQKKMILAVDDWIKSVNLKVSNISFSEPVLKTLSIQKAAAKKPETLLNQLVDEYRTLVFKEAELNPEPAPQEEAEEQMVVPVETLVVSMGFSGAYEDFIALLQRIEDENRKISIQSVSLASGEGNSVSGSLVLEFYAVPKIFDQDAFYYAWDLEAVYGKDNPFSAYGMSRAESNRQSEARVYDFLMTLRPITTDVPTVILGNTYEKALESTIYQDEENVVPVEITISVNAGQYTYRYKIGDKVYPESEAGIAFDPKSADLDLRINSSLRNADSDHSGIVLAVNNGSDLDFNIWVTNDDPKVPRVTFGSLEGKVWIK